GGSVVYLYKDSETRDQGYRHVFAGQWDHSTNYQYALLGVTGTDVTDGSSKVYINSIDETLLKSAPQAYYEYDRQGNLFKTNAENEGASTLYLYDANGNATMKLEALGSTDLRHHSLADILSLKVDEDVAITVSE